VRVLFTGTPVPFEFTPLLGSLIGVVAALLLITVAILAALKMRSERRAQRPGDLPLKKATAPSSEDLYDADDRNPDVVPTNKGMFPENASLYENGEWVNKRINIKHFVYTKNYTMLSKRITPVSFIIK